MPLRNGMTTKCIHHGLAIKRLREIRGLKQEALALEMGEDWSQRKISLLEGRRQIEEAVLEQVAAALQLPVETIETFCEQNLVQALAGGEKEKGKEPEETLSPTAALLLERLLGQIEENKTLYERLLQSEREKVDLLRELLIPASATHNSNGHPDTR